MIEYYAMSDVGLKRPVNQDSYLTITNKYGDFLGVVCDGIGGANAGDVASGELVKYLASEFMESHEFKDKQKAREYLDEKLTTANKKIFDLASKNPSLKGMGTTVTGILLNDKMVITFNAGDSRVYGFIDHKIFRLTVDHSLVNQMLAKGEITYEESLNHPMKHYLVRAVGILNKVEFDIHNVKKMDYYLICSDGLCGYVEDEEILKIMDDNSLDTCKKKCEKLVELALFKGGYDNISVIVVKR